MRFIKYYSLQIYTVITLLVITLSAIFVTPDVARKIILAYMLLFVLHEWEEGYYPGGFLDLISDVMLGGRDNVSLEAKKGSRFYTSIYLFALTLIPYFASSHTWLVLPAVFLGLWEGFIHIMGITIFQQKIPYTPGMVTAEIECVYSIYIVYFLAHNGYVQPIHYLIGALLMVIGFMCMQRGLFHSVGKKYRELPSLMKANIQRIRAAKNTAN